MSGSDYRILTLKGKILDIVERVPASVTGNGTNSTYELVKAENKRRKVRSFVRSILGHAFGHMFWVVLLCSCVGQANDLPVLVKSSALGPFTDVPSTGQKRTIQASAPVRERGRHH